MNIKEYLVETIGDNTLKGTVAYRALKDGISLEQAFAAHHVFYYKEYNERMPVERLVADVAWLYKHGALSVELRKCES